MIKSLLISLIVSLFGLQIHQMVGFSKSLISEAEHGLKKPSSIYLHALLDKFNVNINYILNGEGRMFITGEEIDADGFRRDSELVKELLDIPAIKVYLCLTLKATPAGTTKTAQTKKISTISLAVCSVPRRLRNPYSDTTLPA